MRPTLAGTIGDAWAMFRADRDLLLPVAGMLFFLPLLALLLLVPEMPPLAVDREMSEAAQRALAQTIADWLATYGVWYFIASLIVQFGTLMVLVLYLDRDRPDLGAAAARGVGLLPRYLPAMILIEIPLGIGQFLLLLLLPGLYLFGRMLGVGPVLVAEPPPGIRKAIQRSWAMTRGHGLMTAGLAALSVLGTIVASLVLSIDRAMTAAKIANPVAVVIVDATAAMVTASVLLAMALVRVALYRRLANTGT